jgi:hypothetical protein
MVKKMRFILLSSFVLVLAFSCSSKRNRILSEDEAIARAEEFIKDNGYTDLPPTEDKSKLVPESVIGGTEAEGLRLRHNTLEPKAYGIIQGGRNGDGWYVVFRYNRNNQEYERLPPDFEQHRERYGRAVVMDRFGGNPKIEHQDIGLESKNLKSVVR